MINFSTVHVAGWPGANVRLCFIFIALLGWGNSQGQDTTVNFWGGVTPKQTIASAAEIELTLKLVRNIPFPDTTFYSCPALPDFGDINTTTSLEKYLGLTRRLQRQGRPDCILEICERLLRKVPASKIEITARLLAEEVAVLVRFGDLNKAATPAEKLISLVEKGGIIDHATLLTTAQYLHLKADASDRALAMAQRILDNAKAKQDTYWEMRSLSLIGSITRDVYFGASLRAVPYHREALKIAEARQDTAAIIGEWMALALNYGDAGEQSRYLEYMRNALAYLAGYSDVRRVISVWIAISLQLGNVERLEEAKTYLWKVRVVSQALHLTELARDADDRLFSYNMVLEKYDEAESALLRASNNITDGSKYAEQFYQLAKATNQSEKALFYLEKAYSEVSKKYVGRNAAELSRMETQYNTRETTRTLREKEALLATTSRQRFLLLIFSALITLLLGVAIWTYVRELRLRKVLANQNKIIESQAVELRNLDQLKSRFFANVSHELRTPLSLMIGPLDSILKKESDRPEKEQRLLEFVRNNSQHLLKLVNEILDLSKLETGRMEVKEEAVNFHDFLQPIVSQFSSFGDSESVKMQFDYQADPGLNIMLDANKFEKIVHNFLSNAIKFSPPGTVVKFKVEATDGNLLVSVTDQGPGIHPDDLPHIFDRFYQSKLLEAPTQGGTGIGLSLAAELAGLLGGKIWAESPDPKSGGKGSVFYFRFPLVEVTSSREVLAGGQEAVISTPVPIPSFEKTPSPIPTSPRREDVASKPTILIVEDNPELRSYMQLLLEDEYHVITAQNGKLAWEALQSIGPQSAVNPDSHGLKTDGLKTVDLIISDLMMPVMDGFQLLEKIKSHETLRHLPVIMLTARADIRVKLRALRIGVDDYLTKPFVEEELQVRVKNLLYNYRERVKALAEIGHGEEIHLPEKPDMAAADTEWLERVEAIFSKILSDSQFKIDWVAGQMHLSERQFDRRLKQLTGLTPNNYLREMRLQRAKDFLHEGKYTSVKEVGFAVGFSSTKYFSGLFQERFGVLPSAYLS